MSPKRPPSSLGRTARTTGIVFAALGALILAVTIYAEFFVDDVGIGGQGSVCGVVFGGGLLTHGLRQARHGLSD